MERRNESVKITTDLICTKCGSRLKCDSDRLLCTECEAQYISVGSVPDFRERDEYWCNVSREKMELLISRAKETGDWHKAAKEIIPQYMAHFSDFSRADCQFLWPIDKDSRVLDAGSMWGALTLPVAQYCKEIYAVDKTTETLEFLKMRAEQMGLNNVHVAAASLKKLPFPDGYFDFVILNGVLEWVALEQDIVLEKHWGKRRDDKLCKYSDNPRQMQMNVLKELGRVLKPGGSVYVAIENAIGYIYLTGCPDGHINLRFVSFLPRWMANLISKIRQNCEYRVYVYSPWKLKKLIEDSGFKGVKLWGVFFHYINPILAIPFNLVWRFKRAVMASGLRARLFFALLPRNAMNLFSPSLLAIGQKPGGSCSHVQRIMRMLVSAGVITDAETMLYDAVYRGGRPGNGMTANYVIAEKRQGCLVYFCKIGRSKNKTELLECEAKALLAISGQIQNENIKKSLPELKYFGKIEDMTFLVTSFMAGESFPCRPFRCSITKYLKELDEKISLSIKFLCDFQCESRTDEVKAKEYFLSRIDDWTRVLRIRGLLTENIETGIDTLKKDLGNLDGFSLSLCAVHGDFTFYNNLLFSCNSINVVDFEHFESNGNPFFDLANLIFVPLLMTFKTQKGKMSFQQFVDENRLSKYIDKWMRLFVELSGLDMSLVKLFHRLAVLEQNAKQYPYFRDPKSLPMFGEEALSGLLSLRF